MKIFFDTMIYLHYSSLEQLDYESIFGKGGHTILLPRITLRELDEQKNTHGSRRIQERARKALNKIKQWTQGENICPNVNAEFISNYPSIDFSELGLTSEWNDDILLASIYEFKENNLQDLIVLVTQDTAAILKANQLEIKTIELPDKFKLSTEKDSIEIENEKLKKQLFTFQNSIPKLNAFICNDSSNVQFRKFNIKPPIEADEEEIFTELDKQKILYPQKKVPQKNQPFLLDITSEFSKSEYERYNKDVRTYIKKYEHYLRSQSIIESLVNRTIRFELIIVNDGNKPAEDVDIQLNFPDGFSLYKKEDLPMFPAEPNVPEDLRTKYDLMSIINLNKMNTPFPESAALTAEIESTVITKRIDGYEITEQFDRIKHGSFVKLAEIFLIFDSYEAAQSFKCSYTLRPANLPNSISSELNFIISKDESE